MEDGWDDIDDFEVGAPDPLASNNISLLDDTDDDESYVPESLRDFLKAADKKLENDLAGFLSPPKPPKNNDSFDEDDAIVCDDLEREIREKEEDEEKKRKQDQAKWQAELREKLLTDQKRAEQEESERRKQLEKSQREAKEKLEEERRRKEDDRAKEMEERKRKLEEYERKRKFEAEERQRKQQEEEAKRQKQKVELQRLERIKEEERERKEDIERQKNEMERKRKEQEERERIETEEAERKRKEQEDLERQRNLEEEKFKKEREERERIEKEEAERKRKEQEDLERQRKLEEEKLKREQEERERIEKEEAERKRKEQEDLERQRKLEEEKLKREQEERERIEKEEAERKRKEQEDLERQRKLEEEKLKREQEERERIEKEEAERKRKEQEDLEHQRKLEEEKLKREQEERERIEKEKKQTQRNEAFERKAEEEAQKRKKQEELDRKWQQMVEDKHARTERREKERAKLASAKKGKQIILRIEQDDSADQEGAKLNNDQVQQREGQKTAEEQAEADDLPESPSADALLDIIHPSANVTESHLKRIALEGADDSDEHSRSMAAATPIVISSLPVSSPMIHGIDTNAGDHTNTNDLILTTTMTTSNSAANTFSPSPPTSKIGRKLQMEFNREAHRASLDESDLNEDIEKVNLKKTLATKQQRLKELQSTSFERRRRLQELEEERNSSKLGNEETGKIDSVNGNIPSNAAAAAATRAAAVVDVSSNDEGPIAVPDIVVDHEVNESPRKAIVSIGPVERAMPYLKRRTHQDMKGAPSSPPRPKEIITTSNFLKDGGDRSVSPLGGIHGEIEDVVSPLASPRTMRTRRIARPKSRKGFEIGSPTTTTTSKRRTLTKPDHSFDRLSKPTFAANAKRVSSSGSQQDKINPEEQRRKARERIRKRMEMQRKREGIKNMPLISPRGTASKTESVSAEKARKLNAMRERTKRIEEERIAKLKEKRRAKELRAKKRLEEEEKKREERIKKRAATTAQTKKQAGPKLHRISKEGNKLTVPIAPKFETDRISRSKVSVQKTGKRQSLASSVAAFSMGLRSSAPTMRSVSPEPRRLTIPKAPTFTTSQRSRAKTTPFSSPEKKGKAFRDDLSWSSSLRDVSGISPISKAASSVRTGTLTIPITPNFQPIRKRVAPKSTAEKEREEMEHYERNPFKARPMPTFSSKMSDTGKKRIASRPLTTPEPFAFRTSSKKPSSTKNSNVENGDKNTKKLPVPQFGISKRNEMITSPSKRPVTIPKPFRLSERKTTKQKSRITEESKARRTNKFSSQKSSLTGTHSKSVKRFTETKPFNLSTGRLQPETSKTTRKPKKAEKGNSLGKHVPTGASGLLFHRSMTVRSERVPESKTFRAKPMPDFIPEVIVMKTPMLENDQELLQNDVTSEKESNLQPDTMTGFEKERVRKRENHRTKIRPSALVSKECDNSTISSFKASPVPVSLTREPSIPVRHRDPTKLRSPNSVKRHDKELLEKDDNLPTHRAKAFDDGKQSSVNGMQEAKARLRERLSMRRGNAMGAKHGKTADKVITSPKAFSTLQVQSRLNAQSKSDLKLEEKLEEITSMKNAKVSVASNANVTDVTPVKSNSTIPKSIDLPLKNPDSTGGRRLFEAEKNEIVDTTSGDSGDARKGEGLAVSVDQRVVSDITTNKSAEMVTQGKTDQQNNVAGEGESSSILQLAQEVQRAAEDELSFYGSLDSRGMVERGSGVQLG